MGFGIARHRLISGKSLKLAFSAGFRLRPCPEAQQRRPKSAGRTIEAMAATKAETPAQKGSSGRGPLPLSILALTQAVLEGLAVAFTGILIAYFMVDRVGYWSLDVYVRASLLGAELSVLIAVRQEERLVGRRFV